VLEKIAPHLVKPLDILIPVYADDPRSKALIAVGLTLYDVLAGSRRVRPHRMLRVDEVLQREPCLRAEGLVGGALYADCQTQDARLCLETLFDAARRGARCYNGVTVEQIVAETNGKLGAVVRDSRSGVWERCPPGLL